MKELKLPDDALEILDQEVKLHGCLTITIPKKYLEDVNLHYENGFYLEDGLMVCPGLYKKIHEVAAKFGAWHAPKYQYVYPRGEKIETKRGLLIQMAIELFQNNDDPDLEAFWTMKLEYTSDEQ